MIGLIVAFVVGSVVWLAGEAYRAPLASEGLRGLHVIKRGPRLDELLPLKFDHIDPLVFWGLG